MQPFRKLGPYELVERLAVGGMAEIYVARSRGVQGFEKDYVLKLIHPKYVGDADFIRMLVDEAKLVGQLTHSNIAQVIDLGVDGDAYYILMEYVRGKDLYQILNTTWERELQIPVDCAVYIAKEMASALYYAHTKEDENGRPLNIVHRDISPQNVLLSYQGEVKILDFGVAKAALGARPETRAGIIKGKFRYMSPEQSWGEKLDGRSDVFSVGLCLYEMLTGHPAYEDDGDMQKTLMRMREATFTPPSRLRAEVDNKLEGIVMRVLARERDERYPTAHAFEYDLARYLHLHHAGFTRKDVMVFLKSLFPTETKDVHVPDFTIEHGDQAITTDELDAVDLEEVDGDTDDLTLRQSVPRGEAAGPLEVTGDDFASEETELYLHPDELEEETAQDIRTASMSNEHIMMLVAQQNREVATVEQRALAAPRVDPLAYSEQLPGDAETTRDRTAPHRTVDPRRDTVADFIDKYLPPTAADRALAAHQKFVEILESEQGRKVLVPLMGLALGLFLLLILVIVVV